MALIVYGTKRFTSERIVIYSFSDSPDEAAIAGVVVADPGDLDGMKVFPLDASKKMGEVALVKAFRHYTETNEWPDRVTHFS